MTKAVEKNSAEQGATKQPKKVSVFDKQQIMELREFVRDIDLLSALLDDDKQYAIADAKKMIDAYKKKGVM